MATILSGVILFLVVAATVIYMVRSGRKDRSGCSGSCRGCSGCH